MQGFTRFWEHCFLATLISQAVLWHLVFLACAAGASISVMATGISIFITSILTGPLVGLQTGQEIPA